MSEPEAYEGSTPVRVSARDVHKAVRNILKNEMNLDPDMLRREALDAAKIHVVGVIDAFLRREGYDQANLRQRVERYAEHYLKHDIEDMLRRILESRVEEFLREQGLAVVEVLLNQEFELKLGWRQKPVKFKTVADNSPSP